MNNGKTLLTLLNTVKLILSELRKADGDNSILLKAADENKQNNKCMGTLGNNYYFNKVKSKLEAYFLLPTTCSSSGNLMHGTESTLVELFFLLMEKSGKLFFLFFFFP